MNGAFDGRIDTKLILEATKAAGGAAAAIWAYYRFFKHRSHAPHIEFEVSCRFLGPQTGSFVAEYTFYLLNKGLVRQKIKRIKFSVRGIKEADVFERRDSKVAGLNFPSVIEEVDNLITDEFEYIFVEPGVSQSVRHVSMVEGTFAFVLVRAEFFYKDGIEHSAARVFAVKPTEG